MLNRILKVWVIVLVIVAKVFVFKACSHDFSDREFEKYQSAFETVAEIIKNDFDTLDEERGIYMPVDGNVIRLENEEKIIVVDKDLKELEIIKGFSIYGFSGVDAFEDRIIFTYGGQEHIINTYDGKKPDYSFLKGQDFYTGKLADGWYIANLRLR